MTIEQCSVLAEAPKMDSAFKLCRTVVAAGALNLFYVVEFSHRKMLWIIS